MAMLAIPVPENVGRLFRSIEVPGDRDPSDHITMFYLGEDVSVDTLVRIIPLVFKITESLEPFLVTCRKVTTFPKNDDRHSSGGTSGYPVIAPVESKQLHEIRSKVKRALESKGIDYNNKYPDYQPHVTLSYSKKKPKNIRFPKTQWLVNEIALYGGDNHDDRLFVSFPLGLKLIERKASYLDALAGLYRSSI
jgi:2'-5' RNA ligase